jgi:hypothetical protein
MHDCRQSFVFFFFVFITKGLLPQRHGMSCTVPLPAATTRARNNGHARLWLHRSMTHPQRGASAISRVT